jgi:hypothetical protein
MSIKIMTLVFDYYPTGGGEMLLALSLADFSDDSAGRIFPSVPTLARKTRQSERNVQYQLRKMEQEGFISAVEKNSGGRLKGKKYKSNEYQINIGFFAKGEKVAPLAEGCKKEELRVLIDATKGATAIAPNPPYTHHLEPPSHIATAYQAQVVVEIDDLVEAAVWAASRNGKKIYREAGFRNKVRTRILSSKTGPNPEDMQSLRDWRAAQLQACKAKEARADGNHVEKKPAVKLDLIIDPSAQAKGARFFTNNRIRARFENKELSKKYIN